MEGSVRKDGKTIRVRTQLTKTEDGLLLMSAQYDRQLENILKLQEEIAYSVIKELKITVTIKLAASKPVHNEAYLLTQQGNHILSQFNEEAFRSAIRNFTRAINLDPGYSRAYSGLAIAYLESGGWHSSAAMQNIHEAVKHATHAVELDKENADAILYWDEFTSTSSNGK